MRFNMPNKIYSVVYLTAALLSACGGGGGGGSTSAPANFTVSVTVKGLVGSVELQNNGNVADKLVFASDGTKPFTIKVANVYDITALTQPITGQTCARVSGTTSADITVTVNCTKNTVPRYSFTANKSDNSISTYVMDSITGRLKFINKVKLAITTFPVSITVDPSGKHAYVVVIDTNSLGNYVLQYSIGTDGALSLIGSTTTTTAYNTKPSITIDPMGKFAYVANNASNDVSAYAIDATTGVLTQINCTTSGCSSNNFAAGTSPQSVTIDPLGKFAYVANNGSGDVSAYKIEATGALTQVDCGGTPNCNLKNFKAGFQPIAVTIDPQSHHVYVVNNGSNINGTDADVSAYSIDAITGALTQINCGGGANCHTQNFPTGVYPQAISIDPSGKFAYVANFYNGLLGNSVSQYAIGTDGSLVPNGTVTTGTAPASVLVDPSGKFVYVANFAGNSLSQFTIGTGGTLIPLAPSTAANFAGPSSIATTAGNIPVQSIAKSAYVANYNILNSANAGNISQYSISNMGTLLPMSQATIGAGTNPTSVTIDPAGKYAYVTDFSTTTTTYSVLQYNIDSASGALSAMNPAKIAAGTNPVSITVDPLGRFAYATNKGTNNLSQYLIGNNGALSMNGSVTTGTGPSSLTVDPSGQYAYVTNKDADTISQYTIGVSGTLTPMAPATVVVGTAPQSITIDPTGQYAYVANQGGMRPNPAGGTPPTIFKQGGVSQYLIGSSGALTPMNPASVGAGTNPFSITVEPSGKFAYVANQGGGVWQYAIGQNGLLSISGTAITGTGPYSINVDPSGKYAYVANQGNNNVSQYTIGTTGILTSLGTAATTGNSPFCVITTATWQ